MPSYYDNPAVFANAIIEDVDKFNRLPFYLVKNEVKLFPKWNVWDQLFGDIPWQPNMGDTMKGVRPEPSPIGRTLFYPNRINTDPLKDVFEIQESTEQMVLRWHDYQSKLFNFLPSWQDFRTGQLDFAQKDIIRQIQVGNNTFIRSAVWDGSPNLMVAGKGALNELVTGAPTGTGSATQLAAGSKNLAFITAAVVPHIKQHLSLDVIKMATTILSEDLDSPFFEGAKNMPNPNELLKGRYVLLGSSEAWLQLEDDPTYLSKRNVNMDNVLDFSFSGSLYNRLMYKCDKYPIRFGDDGVFIVPQYVDAETGKTRPNPNYTSITTAKYEVAFMIGADAWRTVKVGPPPKDFTGMSADKFYKMRWNGETRITDQFLIQRGSNAGGDLSYDTNEDGRFLKIKGTCTHGILAGERNNVLPIVFKRYRKATV